jgi:hypothetical protein
VVLPKPNRFARVLFNDMIVMVLKSNILSMVINPSFLSKLFLNFNLLAKFLPGPDLLVMVHIEEALLNLDLTVQVPLTPGLRVSVLHVRVLAAQVLLLAAVLALHTPDPLLLTVLTPKLDTLPTPFSNVNNHFNNQLIHSQLGIPLYLLWLIMNMLHLALVMTLMAVAVTTTEAPIPRSLLNLRQFCRTTTC